MDVLDSIGKYIGGSPANFGLAYCLSLEQNEIDSILPVHTHFGRRKIRTECCRASQVNDCRRSGSGIDHRLDDRIRNIGGLQLPEALDASVETRGTRPHRTRGPDLGE